MAEEEKTERVTQRHSAGLPSMGQRVSNIVQNVQLYSSGLLRAPPEPRFKTPMTISEMPRNDGINLDSPETSDMLVHE